MSGVSVSEGGSGNIDLEMIMAGGPGFAARLEAFAKAAKDAAAAEQSLAKAMLVAEAIMKAATAAKSEAEQQLEANKAEAERLAASLAAADKLQVQLQQKLDRVEALCRA